MGSQPPVQVIARAVTIMALVSAYGLIIGDAMGIPWSGGVTGFEAPDPMVWWIPTPLLSYLWAVWIAAQVAWRINNRPERG